MLACTKRSLDQLLDGPLRLDDDGVAAAWNSSSFALYCNAPEVLETVSMLEDAFASGNGVITKSPAGLGAYSLRLMDYRQIIPERLEKARRVHAVNH